MEADVPVTDAEYVESSLSVPVISKKAPKDDELRLQLYGGTPLEAVNVIEFVVSDKVANDGTMLRELTVAFVVTVTTALVGTVAVPKTGEKRAGSVQVPSMVEVVPLIVKVPAMVPCAPAVVIPFNINVAIVPSS